MAPAGVAQSIETITQRLETACKAILPATSLRSLPWDVIKENTEVLKQYHRQSWVDIAGLIGNLLTLKQSCQNNYEAALRKVCGECWTAIPLLKTLSKSSVASKTETQKVLLLQVIHGLTESFSQSVDQLRANTVLYKEGARVVRKTSTRLHRNTAVVGAFNFCLAGLLYSFHAQLDRTLQAAHPVNSLGTSTPGMGTFGSQFVVNHILNWSWPQLPVVILSGVAIGYTHSITKVYLLCAALNDTAQQFDKAERDSQGVEDLISEHIQFVYESLSNFEALPLNVWADAAKHDCLWQSINKLMEICNEFVKVAEEDA